MAETVSTKKRLSINLSFLNLARTTSSQKSPKIFNDQNGVVGLQIVAALNHDHRQDSIFINGFSSVLIPISPKFSSSPIPILASNKTFEKNLTMEEMELCEEYTCVMSHVGDRLIKKREYFEADLLGIKERIFVVSDNTVSYGGGGGAFLNACFLCDKVLDGLDIFMYRGEKAFCSVECRDKHMRIDESKEKRHRSSKRKPMVECSVSPSCSTSPMQFSAGVAAA